MFERLRRRDNVVEEPQHWPTERMVLEGHADYATLEDLKDLDDGLLVDIAQICDVNEFAPDECIPCAAHVMFLERQRERADALNPPDSADDGTEEFPETPATTEENMTALEDEVADQGHRIEDLQEQGQEPAPQGHRAEHLLTVVRQLEALLEEVLHGPPIPPKDVSLTELGLLVLAADRWVKVTEAQGVELSPNQQIMLDSTKDLVARLRP
jgi:hypothetical protein